MPLHRRGFVQAAGAVALSTRFACNPTTLQAGASELTTTPQNTSPRTTPPQTAARQIEVELPRGRVPLSFIIDDSTCLVNMGKYCMPQFAATYPEREDYQRPWQQWPAEIPDSFVREFGSWCAEQGVKGKYSIVPNPACVGWLDRTLPGWSQSQLSDSLKLVRELMVPNWDIHPEMITHTRAIDLKTGRPFEDFSPAHMENSYPSADVSVDYLASYLAYALRILKNCDLPCEGVTTPGGFGNQVKEKLPFAVFEAVRDVYGSELPHYFKYVEDNTIPKLEAVRDRESETPRVCVNVLAGTGDWFGGWDGFETSEGERYANRDASAGRMVELIEQRQPAVMLCHWPGLYCNGALTGYRDFQAVVLALHGRFKDQVQWMKLSEIGRYWTAKQMTNIAMHEGSVSLVAPFACDAFTLRLRGQKVASLVVQHADGQAEALHAVSTLPSLVPGSFVQIDEDCVVCFDLTKGESSIVIK